PQSRDKSPSSIGRGHAPGTALCPRRHKSVPWRHGFDAPGQTAPSFQMDVLANVARSAPRSRPARPLDCRPGGSEDAPGRDTPVRDREGRRSGVDVWTEVRPLTSPAARQVAPYGGVSELRVDVASGRDAPLRASTAATPVSRPAWVLLLLALALAT